MIWSLIEKICRALEPEERQAVLGDLTESGQTGVPALLAVLGLVARRQLGLWKSWRPWVASLSLLPLLLALASVPSSIGQIIQRYPWRNIPQSHLEIVSMTCAATLLTAVLSWTVGFVASSLARRAALNVATLLTVGALWAIFQQHAARTALGILPLALLQLAFYLAPFAHGLRCGARSGRMAPRSSLALAGAAALLQAILVQFQVPDTGGLVWFALFFWPVLYLVAAARRRVPSVN